MLKTLKYQYENIVTKEPIQLVQLASMLTVRATLDYKIRLRNLIQIVHVPFDQKLLL